MKQLVVFCIVFVALFAFVSCENTAGNQPVDQTDDSDISGNDSDTNNSTDTGDTATDTGNTTSSYEDCASIYYCSTDCTDQACIDACIANGTPTAQEMFNAMSTCWETNCSDTTTKEEFSACVIENCSDETLACSYNCCLHGDQNYPAPYGTLQININADYLLLLTDETRLQQNMVNMSSFATGIIGSSDIIPEENQNSYYYAALIQDNGQQYLQITQKYTTDQGQTQLNPVIFIILPADVALGAVRFGLDTQSVAQMFIADFDGDQVSCYHGFGYGELFITSLNHTAGNTGNISMIGTIEIYNSANAPIYGGNVTSQLGWVNCAPR